MPRWANGFVQDQSEMPQQVQQLTKLLCAYCPHPLLLNLFDDLPSHSINLPSQFRPTNQGRTTICGVRNALDVSSLLQGIDDLSQRLFGDSHPFGQLGQATPFGLAPLKDRLIRRTIVGKVLREGGSHAPTNHLGWQHEQCPDHQVLVSGWVLSHTVLSPPS